ncbi:uncharacterized protein LOC123550090 [Mercenaria mercenaria]|uniref:uncharacterized protein LOC123550090 n=1 Tax=Mercenaria mercenaria TaxID=6596 RepID=UPI00234EB679|nr:uncharacterized protein LOC123550090 [Mercenaria mercenaria]
MGQNIYHVQVANEVVNCLFQHIVCMVDRLLAAMNIYSSTCIVINSLTFSGLVYAEKCTDTQTCIQNKITNCTQGSHVVCYPSIQICACIFFPVDVGVPCTDQAECTTCKAGNEPHCIDRICHCTRVN